MIYTRATGILFLDPRALRHEILCGVDFLLYTKHLCIVHHSTTKVMLSICDLLLIMPYLKIQIHLENQ